MREKVPQNVSKNKLVRKNTALSALYAWELWAPAPASRLIPPPPPFRSYASRLLGLPLRPMLLLRLVEKVKKIKITENSF